jgi:hypothetical protein
MPDPAIGRIVWYRTKVGEYDLPAMITATQETLHAEGVALYLESRKTVPVAMGSTVALDAQGVPPLSGPENVHLTVFSPGLPGNVERPGLDANAGGSFREWDVPLFEPTNTLSPVPGSQPVPVEPEPGSWRWPVIR